MKDAIESAHMGHPDFRVNGRIFATIHPDGKGGMLKLTPDQQREFIDRSPRAFAPEPGAWGLQGATAVTFNAVDEEILGEALTLAWQNTASARRSRSTPRKSR